MVENVMLVMTQYSEDHEGEQNDSPYFGRICEVQRTRMLRIATCVPCFERICEVQQGFLQELKDHTAIMGSLCKKNS
jgi:hypothetical protein